MNYLSTIHIKHDADGYYRVYAGLIEAIVGDKNNYFPICRDMTSREVSAQKHLGMNRFPSGKNKHDAIISAEAYMDAYIRYAKAVIDMPVALRIGHACQFWK